ncbi:MAG TPA: phage holin family protein [Burkholderiales bacterium]|nr:phage holin family protein [Burkholderiales bacterium]
MLRLRAMRYHPVVSFLLFWGVNTLSLWVADAVFQGIAFDDAQALFVSGLLLGMANAFIKPIVLILTLPLTVVTFGLFILVANALMLLLVAWAVPGFQVAGFWSGALIALFVSILSLLINRALGFDGSVARRTR